MDSGGEDLYLGYVRRVQGERQKKQEVRSCPRWLPLKQDAATPLSRSPKLCSCTCRRVPVASRLLRLETRSSRGCPYGKPGVYVLMQPGCSVLHDRQVLLLTSFLVTFGLSHTRCRPCSTGFSYFRPSLVRAFFCPFRANPRNSRPNLI